MLHTKQMTKIVLEPRTVTIASKLVLVEDAVLDDSSARWLQQMKARWLQQMGDLGDRRIIMTMSENGNGNDVCSNKNETKKRKRTKKKRVDMQAKCRKGGEGVEWEEVPPSMSPPFGARFSLNFYGSEMSKFGSFWFWPEIYIDFPYQFPPVCHARKNASFKSL